MTRHTEQELTTLRHRVVKYRHEYKKRRDIALVFAAGFAIMLLLAGAMWMLRTAVADSQTAVTILSMVQAGLIGLAASMLLVACCLILLALPRRSRAKRLTAKIARLDPTQR